MAELPGWDRDRLRTAAPADVAAARLQVYVRQWRPLLLRDLKGEIEDLLFAVRKPTPRQVEDHERRRRNVVLEDLKELVKLQSALRDRLGLEPLDA